MREGSSSNGGGVSAVGLLGVLFVGLKLTGYIDWSWWWVTLPFWGGFALFLVIITLIGLGAGGIFGIAALVNGRRSSRRLRHD